MDSISLTTFALAILYTTVSVASIPIKAAIENPLEMLIDRRRINNYKIYSNDISSNAVIILRKRNANVSVKDDGTDADVVTTTDASLNVNLLLKKCQVSSEVKADADFVDVESDDSKVEIEVKPDLNNVQVDSNTSVGKS
ncbi:18495_t:CDS:2 [Funneliformis geosporum]|uniref:18495_t:CDS:1 n=1 Tax=Funneliformis geosporum TaxID=1117311 RepID=A0A9W4WMF9_9GLOM|nr:18495_t:CDS:2 [Funneliformis geosporum]